MLKGERFQFWKDENATESQYMIILQNTSYSTKLELKKLKFDQAYRETGGEQFI